MADPKKYLDKDGLLYFWSKITGKFVAKDGTKGLSTNDFTTAYKEKLEGIETGANKIEVDTAISSSSTNPVQNKAIYSELDKKVAKVTGKGLSTNDLTNELKTTYDNAVTTINNLSVPTKTSDLTNDSNFVSDDSYVHTDNNFTTALKTAYDKAVTDLANLTIPTKTSDLTNDSDYVSDASYVHTDNNFTNTLKTKLEGIDTGADVNVIESVKVNGTALTPDATKAVNITVPTDNASLANGAGYQTASQVETAINSAISSTYKAKGSVTFAKLPELVKANEGFVYNVSDAFTTTANFVEGAGVEYPAGTNVVIINTTGTTYKYDVLAGMIDTSNFVTFDDISAITNAEIDTIVAS